ncbi:hypothetical protein VNO77_34494 [Canavalia gladiata]|uniref:Uncharacterized protein n=1 Tax=Canavalia gladiata TaxID=3824 RepID=A0AAN9KED8_CANGL
MCSELRLSQLVAYFVKNTGPCLFCVRFQVMIVPRPESRPDCVDAGLDQVNACMHKRRPRRSPGAIANSHAVQTLVGPATCIFGFFSQCGQITIKPSSFPRFTTGSPNILNLQLDPSTT